MVTPRGGVFIGLGSNLGNREQHIQAALAELQERGDIAVVSCSTLHETDAVGGPDGQGPYLNAVAEIATHLPPQLLLERMTEIEARHGRERIIRNGPRTLDLDLLLYRSEVMSTPNLVIPHPRMWQRSFVMEPLAEICELDRLVSFWRLRARQRLAPAAGPYAAAV